MGRRLLYSSPRLLIIYFSVFLFLLLLFLWNLQRLPLTDTTLPPTFFVGSAQISNGDIGVGSGALSDLNKRLNGGGGVLDGGGDDEFIIPANAESYLSVDDIFDYYGISEGGSPPRDPTHVGEEEPAVIEKADNPSSSSKSSSDLHSHFSDIDFKVKSSGPCRMETCFNFDRCQQLTGSLKVYVYPLDKFVPISGTYEKILNRITSSHYFTNDPDEACLFVLSIDTLDRDVLSHDYVRNIEARLKNLPVIKN